jgi:multidrug resistance efflux pump
MSRGRGGDYEDRISQLESDIRRERDEVEKLRAKIESMEVEEAKKDPLELMVERYRKELERLDEVVEGVCSSEKREDLGRERELKVEEFRGKLEEMQEWARERKINKKEGDGVDDSSGVARKLLPEFRKIKGPFGKREEYKKKGDKEPIGR